MNELANELEKRKKKKVKRLKETGRHAFGQAACKNLSHPVR